MTGPESSFSPPQPGEAEVITILSRETKDQVETSILQAISGVLAEVNPGITLKSGENSYTETKENYLKGTTGDVRLNFWQNEQNGDLYLELALNDDQYPLIEQFIQEEVARLEKQYGRKVTLKVRTIV